MVSFGFGLGPVCTFGSIDLVSTDGHKVHLPVRDVDGDLANGLRGVRVEEHILGATDTTWRGCGHVRNDPRI